MDNEREGMIGEQKVGGLWDPRGTPKPGRGRGVGSLENTQKRER